MVVKLSGGRGAPQFGLQMHRYCRPLHVVLSHFLKEDIKLRVLAGKIPSLKMYNENSALVIRT